MSRCKHLNMSLGEESHMWRGFDVRDGHYVEDQGGEIFPTGRFTVKCFDCDFYEEYGPHRQFPKWLKERWEQIQDEVIEARERDL